MPDDLCDRLTALSRSEHSDLSVAAEAVEEIGRLREALAALVDHEASYHGNKIHIECDSHDDAIGRMHRARAVLAGNGKG